MSLSGSVEKHGCGGTQWLDPLWRKDVGLKRNVLEVPGMIWWWAGALWALHSERREVDERKGLRKILWGTE